MKAFRLLSLLIAATIVLTSCGGPAATPQP